MFETKIEIKEKDGKYKIFILEKKEEWIKYLKKFADSGRELIIGVREFTRSDSQNALYFSVIEAIAWYSDIIPDTISNASLRKELLHSSFKRAFAQTVLKQKPIFINGMEYYEFCSTAYKVCQPELFSKYLDFVLNWVEVSLGCNYNELLLEYRNKK